MRAAIDQFSFLIASYDIDEVFKIPYQRTTKARLLLNDGCRLNAQESSFLDTGRWKYSYQWMNPDNSLIIRWDNADHHPEIATHPNHKHVGSDVNVQPSEPMTLEMVLTFIAAQITSD